MLSCLKYRDLVMPYIEEEGGRLNNFAVEPKVYQAAPATKKEKRNYIILSVVGLILVAGLIFVTFSISNAG
jgi:hypothetical protein